MSKKLNLEEFLNYYRKFYSIPTWTKVKRKNYEELIKFLNKHKNICISSSRDSNTTKVQVRNGFTIFIVPYDQRGKMIPYRGMWVLIYCIEREKFKHYLEVFILDKGINKKESHSLKKEFDYRYEDLV